jgi:hypothetical protein
VVIAGSGFATDGATLPTVLEDTAGRMWTIGTSATQACCTEASTWMAHTNHYVALTMIGFETHHKEESLLHLTCIEEVLSREYESAADPLELLARIPRSRYEVSDGSICVHPDVSKHVADHYTTAASIIMDLGGAGYSPVQDRPARTPTGSSPVGRAGVDSSGVPDAEGNGG